MKQTYYHTTIYNIQNQTEITRSIPDFDPSLAIPCQDLLVGQGDGKRLVLRKISKGWSSNRIESTCSLFRSGVVYLRRIGKTIPTYAMFFVRSGLQWIVFSRVGNVVSAQDAMLYWKNDKDKANPFRVIEPIPFDKHGGTWAARWFCQILGPHDSPGLPRTGKGRLICFCRVFVCF